MIDAIHDDQGALVGFAKITRDITERREAQATLQRCRNSWPKSQKMDALGQLTGGVAHDFNNLLMIVSGHIQTLKKRVADDPRATRAAEAIELAAQRGAALTRQLLTFSRRQHVNPSATDISEQLASFREILASGVGSAERLAIHIPTATWPVKVDVAEFEIALVNLVINARDAMPDGGAVTIAAENIVLDPSGNEKLAQDRKTAGHVAQRIAVTGGKQHRQAGPLLSDRTRQCQSVHSTRHDDVGEHEVDRGVAFQRFWRATLLFVSHATYTISAWCWGPPHWGRRHSPEPDAAR